MTIGVVTTSFPRYDGDPAGGFVEELARWLLRYDDVEVLCASDERKLFYRGGAPDALTQGWRPWLAAAAFSSQLALEVGRRRASWSRVMSNWMVPCGLVAATAGRGLPHLCIVHGSDARLLGRHAAGRSAARWLASESDLVFVADVLRSELGLHEPTQAGRVAPMGVHRRRAAAGSRSLARRQLGISGDELMLLCIGRLTFGKGVDVLFDALTPGIPGVVTFVAGAGPLWGELQRRQNGSLRLAGEVAGGVKERLFDAADVLVLPSRTDGAPVAIAEAQAAGLPVIASRTGGVPELVTDGVDGLLVSPGATLMLREAILRLQQSPSLRQALATASAARGATRDWSVAAPAILGAWAPAATPGPHLLEVRRV